MTQTAVNYARVLWELGVPGGDVLETKRLLEENPELLSALKNPLVSQRQKEQVIGRVFPSAMRSFLKVACRNQKIGRFDEICRAYEAFEQEMRGILPAVLCCVTPPADGQLEGIKALLADKHKKQEVLLEIKEDKSLLGGFILKAGGVEYDYSLKGRLDRLGQRLIRR